MRNIRILVISSTPWDDNNSFGNTYSNLFDGMDGIEIANICLKPGKTNNSVVSKTFQITVKDILKSFFTKEEPGREIVEKHENGELLNKTEQKTYDFLKFLRFRFFFWIRDLIWATRRWKNSKLYNFITDFDPDIIFQPIYFSSYINDIVLWCKNTLSIPMIGYISDDNYTLKRINFSIFFWIERLWKRRWVGRAINACNILYTVSQIQKEEYEKIFDIECKVLTKNVDYSKERRIEIEPKDFVSILYAGNLYLDRWKSLLYISKAVKELIADGVQVKLDIYTGTPLTKQIKKAFDNEGTFLHSAIPYQKLLPIMEQADIVVHVEGLSIRSRLSVHQSFSTKLVDYFETRKCIFAIGTYDEASIQHLVDNEAAVVCQSKDVVYQKLRDIVLDSEKRDFFREKAYECGKKNHNKSVQQSMMKKDFIYCINHQNKLIPK